MRGVFAVLDKSANPQRSTDHLDTLKLGRRSPAMHD